MADSRSTFLDLSGKKRSDLLRLKLELGSDMDHIRGQLDKAKHEYRKTGRRTDEDWFRRAKSVLRIKGRQIQQIQIRLVELKAAKKEQLPTVFMKLAKEKLPDDKFQKLLDAALEEINKE
jgi:hypothetical protein